MNSSRKKRDQILGMMSGKRAERLLTDLANMVLRQGVRRRDEDVRRLSERYPEVFDLFAYSRTMWKFSNLAKRDVDFETVTAVSLSQLQSDLRGVWDSPDERSREWALFIVRQNYSTNAIAHLISDFLDAVSLPAREGQSLEEVVGTFLESNSEVAQKILALKSEDLKTILESNSEAGEGVYGLMRALPPPTPMEAALFHLQRIGDKLRHCPNPECPAPYFIADKKGQKYCSPECAAPSQRESKRKWWYENRAKGGA